MDDYYDLLGVDADAPTDEIRAAYRDRKDGARRRRATAGKADAAKLNKAWNVLSDPYQRGRYDEQREQAVDDGDDVDDDDVDVQSNGSSEPATVAAAAASSRATRARAAARAGAADDQPARRARTIPRTKQRVIAMAIDLVVLLVLVVVGASSPSSPRREVAEARGRRHGSTRCNDRSPTDDRSRRRDATTSARRREEGDSRRTGQRSTSAQKTSTTPSRRRRTPTKAARRRAKKLDGRSRIAVIGVIVPPRLPVSRRSRACSPGATLGKRLQHLKVVREDGAPLGWGGVDQALRPARARRRSRC